MGTQDQQDMADHRPDIYYEGETRIFRASSFGSCEQNLVRTALGHTPADAPEFMQGKYVESAALEAPILKALEEQHGWRVMRPAELPSYPVDDTGQYAMELKVPGGVIRCHPDAIVRCYRLDGLKNAEKLPWKLGDQRVVEVKALSVKSSPFDLSKNPNYWWQFAIEMAVTRLPGIYVVGWKDEDGELVRTEDGKVRLSVAWYTEPPETLLAIKKRAAKIGRMIADAEEGRGIPPCDYKQYPCGYWAEHEGGIWAKDELEELPSERVGVLVNAIALEKAYMDNSKAVYDSMRVELLEILKDMGKDDGSYRAGNYKVSVVKKAGRVTYDYKAMKDAGLEIGAYAKTGKPSEYVTVEEL